MTTSSAIPGAARPYPQTRYAAGSHRSRPYVRARHAPCADRILRPRTCMHLVTSPEETDQRIRKAFQQLGFNPEGPPGQITGRSKMSFRKNRWAAEISATVSPLGSGSMVLCRLEHGREQALRPALGGPSRSRRRRVRRPGGRRGC